jgi:hypothetical protein
MANGYSATGYGLAIRDEKDKSSMGYEIGTKNPKGEFRFMLKLPLNLLMLRKNDTGIREKYGITKEEGVLTIESVVNTKII